MGETVKNDRGVWTNAHADDGRGALVTAWTNGTDDESGWNIMMYPHSEDASDVICSVSTRAGDASIEVRVRSLTPAMAAADMVEALDHVECVPLPDEQDLRAAAQALAVLIDEGAEAKS